MILETALQQPDLSPRGAGLSCHRPRRVHGLGSRRLPGAEAARVESHDHARWLSCGQGVSREDDGTEPVMAERCQLLFRGRLGLVLLDSGAGRLLAFRAGRRSEVGHDRAFHQRHVGKAVEFTGMRQGPVGGRHQVPQRSWLGVPGADLRGVSARVRNPSHLLRAASSQTNRKIERFHETLKARVNLLVYTSPDELRRTICRTSSNITTIAPITKPSAT